MILTAVMRATAMCLILMRLRQEAKTVKWRKKSFCHRQQTRLKGKAATQKLQSSLGKVCNCTGHLFISLFLHDEVIDILVHETNCYA